MRHALTIFALVLGAISVSTGALANAPAPRDVCGVKGLPCTACSRAPDAGYDACTTAAKDGGLVYSCHDYRREGDRFITDYYCPPGLDVGYVYEEHPPACNRCSAAGDASSSGVALLATAVFGAATIRRRSRRGKAESRGSPYLRAPSCASIEVPVRAPVGVGARAIGAGAVAEVAHGGASHQTPGQDRRVLGTLA